MSAPVVLGRGGPDPVAPCVGCPSRVVCRAPCQLLREQLTPAEVIDYREVSSPALMEGRGCDEPFYVLHPALSDALPEVLWPRLVERYKPLLEKLASGEVPGLARVQREVLRLMLHEGLERRDISRLRRTSRQCTHKSFAALLRRLRELLGALPADLQRPHAAASERAAAPTTETTMPSITSTNTARKPRLAPAPAPAPAPVRLDVLPPNEAVELAPGITAQVVTITPEDATRMLEHKATNRPISDSYVDRYARDMREGRWRTTHQGLALGRDGEVVDGEHRLWAVVRAGVPVRMMVVRGLSPEDRATFDQGRARSVSAVLTMAGATVKPGVPVKPRVVSWIRCLAQIGRAGRPMQVSTAYVEGQLEQLGSSIAWAVKNAPRKRPLNRSPVVAAFVHAHAVAPTTTEAFVAAYASGIGLAAGSPVLAAREYVMGGCSRDGEPKIVAKILRALHAHLTGETLQRLIDGAEGVEYFQRLHAERT